MKPSGIVTLLTDFGLDDAYVGAMKGAILSVNAKAAVVDITHGVRPGQGVAGAVSPNRFGPIYYGFSGPRAQLCRAPCRGIELNGRAISRFIV